MRSRILRVSLLVLLSLIISSVLIGVAECFPQSNLWTTNASGTAEINLFSPGDAIFIKSNGLLSVLPGVFKVYVFTGIHLTEGDTDWPFSSLTDLDTSFRPSGFTPSIVTTDISGNLALVKIWDSATIGVYTLVLDYLGSWSGTGNYIDTFVPSAAYPGSFDSNWDYRDDLCDGIKIPSFNVVPEPATIALAATMVGAFGCFLIAKRKVTVKKK